MEVVCHENISVDMATVVNAGLLKIITETFKVAFSIKDVAVIIASLDDVMWLSGNDKAG